jgi:diguanylate cyclase (GGDEF)-like protein
LEDVIERISRSLEASVRSDDDYRRQLARRFHAFVRRLARKGDSRCAHGLILRTIAAVVRADTAAFALYDENEHVLAITATHGYPHAIVEHLRIPPGQGVIGEVFSTGRPTLGHRDPQLPRRLRYRTDSFLAVPIVASGRTLAVITLTDRADDQPFDARDLMAARMFAAPAALALARERIAEDVDELTRAATVDPVTGLFNRRYFETRILAEVQRARRQQQDLALLMVDIDDFKRINDTFGHLEGDRALREVADLLRSGVRIFDVCARYGGEEFAIVMPGASLQMAVQVAERIRRGIYDRSGLDPLPITVSVGVGFLRSGDSAEDLVGSADRALILAKRGGKNTVRADDSAG